MIHAIMFKTNKETPHRMSFVCDTLTFQIQTRLLAEFILTHLLRRTENLKILTSLAGFLLIL